MKIFANKKFKRFVIILMSVIMLFNVIAPQPLVPQAEAASLGGILMAPLTALAGGLAFAFQIVLDGVMMIAGSAPSEEQHVFISTIIYNELPITDANIFNPSTENPLLKKAEDGTNGIAGIVQNWYSITRMMAIAASLVILVYVAIKIVLASTGKDKAKYTELLKDWLLCILLIFTLHYVMAAILFCSDAIVQFFATAINADSFDYKIVQQEALAFNDTSIVYALVWIALMVYTFVFLVLYLKRLILICFFVVISPLIVILSTINKLRGKGSGILDTWLKQFIANVVMQPIDALLFAIIGGSIMYCFRLEQPLLAIAFVIAFFPMRAWVTQFFDQKSDQNSQDSVLKSTMKGVGNLGMMGTSKLSNLANNPRKPRFSTSNLNGAIEGANVAGAGKAGAGKAGVPSDVGGGKPDIKGRIPLSDDWQNDYHSKTGAWADNADVTLEPNSFEAERKGGITNPTGGVGLGNVPAASGKKGLWDYARKGAGIAGRAGKVGLSKGIGMQMGLAGGAFSMLAGKNFLDGYGKASGATEKLTGKTIDGTAKKASQYYESMKDNEDGYLAGFYSQAKSDVGSIGNSVSDYVENSYIVSGDEKRVSQEQQLGEILSDSSIMDLGYELMDNYMDNEDPIYKEYMSVSSRSAKDDIIKQLLIQEAINSKGVNNFNTLMNKRGARAATLSVLQSFKDKAKENKNEEKIRTNASNNSKNRSKVNKARGSNSNTP